MKFLSLIFIVILPIILSACTTPSITAVPATESYVPELTITTAEPALTQVSAGDPPVAIDHVSSSDTVTLNDNGKTLNLRVGDSFLLNLGTDVYDWDVAIDDQSVISLHMGVLVVKGAQGIFDAHTPGTANLTAVGNPQCLKSNPPCMMPSIMFRITVIVQ